MGQGDSIELKCGATLEQTDDGEFHSLILHIRKWFNGSREFLLSVNEELEYIGHDRYRVEPHVIGDIREFVFTILSKNLDIFYMHLAMLSEIDTN